jgi:nucleotide-binding universal stress UspA family protein
MTAPVVVGVDDIDYGRQAMALAAREADLRGAPLWIAHAYRRIPAAATAGTADSGHGHAAGPILDPATEPLVEAVKLVRDVYPGLQVDSYATGGPVAVGLTGLASDATMLVIGHRGRGGFAGMLLGSVALRTVTHATCPIVVARGADHGANRVLVGLDVADRTGGAALLGFAFEAAALRGAELVVMHAWEDQGYFYPDPTGDYTRDHLADLDSDHRRHLDELLAPWRQEHPETVVDVLVQGGSPARRLVDASAQADMLVIGGRPHRDGIGMKLGGLAYSLLHHAHCPIVIVPDR